jgi:hypothetical protein
MILLLYYEKIYINITSFLNYFTIILLRLIAQHRGQNFRLLGEPGMKLMLLFGQVNSFRPTMCKCV